MPEQTIVDSWNKNIELAKSNPTVWFDSIVVNSNTDSISNDHVIKKIDAYIQYIIGRTRPSTLKGRRFYSEVWDVSTPSTFGRMLSNACQSAQFDLVEEFNSKIESYVKSKTADSLNPVGLSRQRDWALERELITAVLSSYDSRLYSMHSLFYDNIPNASWKPSRYKELVYTDTARVFCQIMTMDNQYWMIDRSIGADTPTVSTQKKRFVRHRRKAGAEVLIEHAYQRVLNEKSILNHWFSNVVDHDTRMETVKRWRSSIAFKWEIQSELERLIWMTEMNKQLELTIDRMT